MTEQQTLLKKVMDINRTARELAVSTKKETEESLEKLTKAIADLDVSFNQLQESFDKLVAEN